MMTMTMMTMRRCIIVGIGTGWWLVVVMRMHYEEEIGDIASRYRYLYRHCRRLLVRMHYHEDALVTLHLYHRHWHRLVECSDDEENSQYDADPT